MRPKSILLLVLALGCGLIASWGISDVMERNGNRGQAPAVETEKICVAIKDINVNDEITPELVKLEDWPKEKILNGAIRTVEEILGRRAGTKIIAGESILASRLVDGKEGASNQLPLGYRPFPLRVNAESSAAGLIKPGDRVDVQLFVKRNPALGIEETRTQTILSYIRVFAVDQHFKRENDEEEAHVVASTISLVVTLEEANKLSLATKVGELSLLLRHPDDDAVAKDSTNVSELFGLDHADTEAERVSPTTTADTILQKLNSMKGNPDPQPEPVSIEVTPAIPVSLPHKLVVLRGNEIEVVEFPTDGGLPSNMPAATGVGTSTIQHASPQLTNPDTTAAPEAGLNPASSLDNTPAPARSPMNGDSNGVPPEVNDLQDLSFGNEG